MFPDGRRVVSCDGDFDGNPGVLKVWDIATGRCVATLEGHSDFVRCGVHCTFVMMCLRRRSMVLPSYRTGGASCLGRTTRRSRCGTWRPASAWRRCEGTRITCVARRPLYFVMMCLRCRSRALRCFRTGGASCLGRATTRSRCGTSRPANAWRRCEGTRVGCVARRPLYFCDDVSSS